MPQSMFRNVSLALMLTLVSVVASGCLLRASSEEIPATAVAQNLPTLTPTATETPIEPTPEPQITTEFIVVTATPDETTLALQATADALATLGFFLEASPTPEATLIAQFDVPTLAPLIVAVTETIAAATQVYIDQTLTAEAPIFLPSDTPTPEFFPTATTEIVQPIGTDCVHVVSAGENLFRIGLRYGVPYQTIANYNGIANPAIIRIGQQITIPNCGQGAVSGIGSGGSEDTGSGGFPASGSSTVGAGGICGSTYVVDQYETLFGISLKCNVLIRDIMALNPSITNPDLIYFNQTLSLP